MSCASAFCQTRSWILVALGALAGCANATGASEPTTPTTSPPSFTPSPTSSNRNIGETLALARTALAQRDYRSASKHAARGVQQARAQNLERSTEYSDLLFCLAAAYVGLRSFANAQTTLEVELSAAKQFGAFQTERGARALWLMSRVRRNLGDKTRAESDALTALKIRESQSPPNVMKVTESLLQVAQIYAVSLRTAEAITTASRGLGMLQEGSVEANTRLAELNITIGEAHRYAKNYGAAKRPFEAAVQYLSKYATERRTVYVESLKRASSVYRWLGEHEAERDALRRALSATPPGPSWSAEQVALIGELFMAVRRVGDTSAIADTAKTYGYVRRVHERGRITTQAIGAEPRIRQQAPSNSDTESPALPNAARVVAGLRAQFRDCYVHALAVDRGAAGQVRLTMHVQSNGTLRSAHAIAFGLPVSAVDCILTAAMTTKFTAPPQGHAVVVVPITLIPSE